MVDCGRRAAGAGGQCPHGAGRVDASRRRRQRAARRDLRQQQPAQRVRAT